ncbi:MAG TPA: protein kinase [Myxococcales bacterium]|nr:protein kinase [Myxococcales bacterium]
MLDRLAAGGMAEILAARVLEGPLQGRVLVLKRMLPHLARETSYVQMFQDEARILSMLDHPNVVRMFDSGAMDGLPYIAMEYIEGHDVRAAIIAEHRRGRRIPLGQVLAIVAGAAAGLDYAHERKDPSGRPLDIIHRDISPHNLLVTYDGLVKVVDFGIAKAQGRLNETRQTMLKGKLPYMAPEQAGGGAIDRRADVYALGAVLFELTTGRRPYRGKNDLQLLNAILYTPVPQPSTLVAEYPPELERIVLRALARSSSERYGRAEEVRQELLAFARAQGLDASAAALGRYMQELFSVQLAELRRAREEGVDLPTVLVGWAKETEGGDDDDEEVEKPGGERATGQPWWVEERKVGGLKVVSLGGRITELFRGAEVAQRLEGRVVLDLGEVERITSFGVREWLRMIDDSAGRLTELYLSRCTEAVVNQLRMIRRLSGKGQVVSFYAPYKCTACQSQFEALLEGGRHGDKVRRGIAPQEPCPRCGADGQLDDDPRAYFSFASGMVTAAPPDVKAALESLHPAPAAVDKAVHGGTTRYRVRAPVDETLRWGRILEGAEGGIEVDLGRAPKVTPPGGLALTRALRALGPEVRSVAVIGAPVSVLEEMVRGRDPRVSIRSVRVPTRCKSCGAERELEVQVGVALPRCGTCGGALEAKISPAARALVGPAVPAGGSSWRRTTRVALAAAVALALAAGGAAALLPRVPLRPRPAAGAVPAWAGGGVEGDGERIFVPGRGTGASADQSLAAAKADATARLGEWLAGSEAPGGGQEEACHLARRPLPDAAASAKVIGGAAAPALSVAEQVTHREGQEVYARFALPRAAADQARASLRASAEVLGMTLRRCGEALVVTQTDPSQAAHRAGVRAGDVIAELDGAPPASPEGVAGAAKAAAGAGQELKLVLEVVGGARRTVRLRGE